MKLYSAHIILYVQLKSGRQRKFPVWENIVLFSAGSSDAAFAKAEAYGRREADEEESFTWGNKPARWVFAGVRKVTPCHVSASRNLDGVEVACNEFELNSVAAIAQLVAGEPVELLLSDQFVDSSTRARQSGRIVNVKKLA
jgi:hypothetical protein